MIELRWVEADDEQHKIPVAMKASWPEVGPTYFKLQYRSTLGDSVWMDVPVEWQPHLSSQGEDE